MATLIVEQDGERRGGVMGARVVIGRRPGNHIVIPDRSVSRLHAWIGQSEGNYFIADTGTRNGTYLNGHPVRDRQWLEDGDQIRIGPVAIVFHKTGVLPAGVTLMDFADHAAESDDGIFLDCTCGAPLWAPWDFAGRVGQCRYCGQAVTLPKPANGRAIKSSSSSSDTVSGMPVVANDHRPAGGVVSAGASPLKKPARAPSRMPGADLPGRSAPFPKSTPPPQGAHGTRGGRQPAGTSPSFVPSGSLFDRPAAESRPPGSGREPSRVTASVRHARTPDCLCGACQSLIGVLEEKTRCPDCGVEFHADCWVENRGCSTYGCRQVNVLQPKPPPVRRRPMPPPRPRQAARPAPAPVQTAPAPRASADWGYLLVPAALVAGLLGLVAFGIPSWIAAILISAYIGQASRRARRFLNFALAASIVLALAGVAISWFWWLATPSGGGGGLPR